MEMLHLPVILVVTKNGWKCRQVTLKNAFLVWKWLKISPGLLENIHRWDLNGSWPFGSLVGCKNAAAAPHTSCWGSLLKGIYCEGDVQRLRQLSDISVVGRNVNCLHYILVTGLDVDSLTNPQPGTTTGDQHWHSTSLLHPSFCSLFLFSAKPTRPSRRLSSLGNSTLVRRTLVSKNESIWRIIFTCNEPECHHAQKPNYECLVLWQPNKYFTL